MEGELNGIKVVIFDSELGYGRGRGWYQTIVAVRTRHRVFRDRTPPEKISSGQEWQLLYRRRFWQIGWTLSIERLEVLIGSLQQTLEPETDKRIIQPAAKC